MNLPTIVVLLAGFVLATPGKAQEPKADFSVNAKAGYQYDSNVSIRELDENTGQADNALLLELGIDSRVPLSHSLSINAGYRYSQSAYQQFSEFDTALHQLHAEARYRIAGFDTGLALRHFAAGLDGDRFLDIRQVSPSVARLLGNKLYLRGAYTQASKTYADHESRNADNNASDVDAYFLLDGMRHYLAFGYRLEHEDAMNPELDFAGDRLKLGYGRQFEQVHIKALLALENRDYRNVTESLGIARRDERLRASMEASLPVGQHFSFGLKAQYVEIDSNLESARVAETTYNASLSASF
ncbi:MAG: surface lipoprotein assembly modifier [Woeseia sp.]